MTAGVINMDDIAEEEEAEEDQSRRESERARSEPSLAWVGCCRAAVPWGTKFHCLSFFPDDEGREERVSIIPSTSVPGIIPG